MCAFIVPSHGAVVKHMTQTRVFEQHRFLNQKSLCYLYNGHRIYAAYPDTIEK